MGWARRPRSACPAFRGGGGGGNRAFWQRTGPGGAQPWRPSRRPCLSGVEVDMEDFAGRPTGTGLCGKKPMQSDGMDAYSGGDFKVDYQTRYDADFKEAFQRAWNLEPSKPVAAAEMDSARELIAPGGKLGEPQANSRLYQPYHYQGRRMDPRLRKNREPFGVSSHQVGLPAGTFERCIAREEPREAEPIETTYGESVRKGAEIMQEQALVVLRNKTTSREEREKRWLTWQRRKVRKDRAACLGRAEAGTVAETAAETSVSVMPAGVRVRHGKIPAPDDASKFNPVTWLEKEETCVHPPESAEADWVEAAETALHWKQRRPRSAAAAPARNFQSWH